MRFGPEVPVRTIEVTDPTIEAIPQAEREVIGEKVSYRLAQQPGSYVVLKYVRPVVKRRGTETMLTAPAPANVLERSCADVSFLTYLVDVLQRISVHPANRAIELTPRMWKSRFADAPMRSDLGPHHHDPPSH